MARFNPQDILSTYAAIAGLNANFDAVAALLENCVFRDGTSPNQMEASLNMNHNRIENVGAPVAANDAVRLSDLVSVGSDSALATALASVAGAGLIGVASGETVQEVLDDLKRGPIVTPEAFGALGDAAPGGVGTDDRQAFLDAVAYLKSQTPPGGTLKLSNKHYRVSGQIDIDFHINIIGQGYGERPGVAPYTFPYNYYGSVVVFDAGSNGFVLHPHTRETDVATVEANPSAYYTEPSAFGSLVTNVMVISRDNGAAGTKDGIYSRTKLFLSNVRVYGFSRDNVAFAATAGSPDGALTDGTTYGNANGSILDHVHAERGGREGIRIAGRDANNITLIQPDCRHNGRWGLSMTNLIGNHVIGGHFDSNNRLLLTPSAALGAIQTTSNSAHHVFSPGPYIEVSANGLQCSLIYPSMMVGGPGSTDTFHPSTSDAVIISAGQAIRRGYSGFNNLAATTLLFGIGRDPGTSSGKNIAYFGSSEDSGGVTAYRFKYQNVTTGVWSWNYRNAIDYIQYGSGQTSWYATLTNPMFVGFPQGLSLGDIATAPRLLPQAAAAPASGTYRKGDTIQNSNVASGQPMGWRCSVAGSPGTWLALPNLP